MEYSSNQTQVKRKNETEHCEVTFKKPNNSLPPSKEIQDTVMHELPPARPTTPPLGMTLSHYNPNTGTYTSSQIDSAQEVKSPICTGMTAVYRAPCERWGSCLI